MPNILLSRYLSIRGIIPIVTAERTLAVITSADLLTSIVKVCAFFLDFKNFSACLANTAGWLLTLFKPVLIGENKAIANTYPIIPDDIE